MSANLYPLYTKGINRHILLELSEYAPKWKDIFHMSTTGDRYVWAQGWEGYPKPSFRVYGGPIAQAQFKPSFNKQYIVRSFALGDSVAQEDIDDDMYGVIHKVIPKKGGLMARAFEDLMEYETSGYFAVQGYTAGTSVAGMSDGVSLFSTSHPISVSQSGILASNRPSVDADLSIATAQAMATNLRTQLAPNNLTYLNNELRCVVYNPVLHYIAHQIYKGQWERGTADRNKNFLTADSVDLISWPYFTKSGTNGTNNAWFGIGREHFLRFLLRAAADTHTDYDIQTNSQMFATNMRFDYGADDWRGTYGSKGA